jgi:RNA polymerase sigma-70 factor (ECF subfamily)
MLRFKQGDQAAFEQLVRRNTHKVHALVYRFLGSAELADDLTQEVFLRVFRTAHRYEPAAKFSTWLYRIVANLAFNVMRSRKRAHVYPMGAAGDSDDDTFERNIPDEHANRPGESLDQDELRKDIACAIAQLPENQRVAMVLHQYEHKAYDDIAEVLDCTTMAVKSLLSRARENLRQSLRRYLHEPR